MDKKNNLCDHYASVYWGQNLVFIDYKMAVK